MAKKTNEEALSYAEAMAALERIQQELETNQVPVDQLAPKVARAKALVAQCRAQLRQTEDALQQILGEE